MTTGATPEDTTNAEPVAPDSALTLEWFSSIQRSQALSKPINLTVSPGTVLGVVGPNGVGKSSLLGSIAQTGVKHTGRVKFARHNLAHTRAALRSQLVSFLSQDLQAPAELRVTEIVEIGARAGGHRPPQPQVEHALEQVGISHLTHRRYGTLSGGQKQLTQIARVLAQDTPVVVLDEPTAALDLFHQRTVEQQMRWLGNEGKIVIAALHDLTLALNVCTQIMLLDPHGNTYTGLPGDVLGPELVHAAYSVRTSIHTTPQGRNFLSTDDISQQSPGPDDDP
jgi:ABC-type cobalamin/Fe3+-siderophores transport system ATPase subunit